MKKKKQTKKNKQTNLFVLKILKTCFGVYKFYFSDQQMRLSFKKCALETKLTVLDLTMSSVEVDQAWQRFNVAMARNIKRSYS